jgi:hypothetical protein
VGQVVEPAIIPLALRVALQVDWNRDTYLIILLVCRLRNVKLAYKVDNLTGKRGAARAQITCLLFCTTCVTYYGHYIVIFLSKIEGMSKKLHGNYRYIAKQKAYCTITGADYHQVRKS